MYTISSLLNDVFRTFFVFFLTSLPVFHYASPKNRTSFHIPTRFIHIYGNIYPLHRTLCRTNDIINEVNSKGKYFYAIITLILVIVS